MIRLRQRRSIALAILVVALALVAAACSSSDDADDTTTTTAAAPEATTTTAATEEPGESAQPTEPVAPPSEVGETLSGLTVVDDLTFTVELSVADPEFKLRTASPAFFPLPTVAYANTYAYNEAPIGNGPFMFDEGVKWEHDASIDLIRNPDYQGDDVASLDAINFVITTDPKTDYLDALDGNLDILDNIDVDFLASAPTDFPDRYGESANTGIGYLAFPFYLNDTFTKEHRQAMNMAIDKQLIMDKIFNGSRDPAHSVVPPNLGGRDDVCPSWNYDADAAKQLWDAAGPLDEIAVWFNEGGGHEEWVGAIVNMWVNVLGVDASKITFETRPWADYLSTIQGGDGTGPFRLGWGMDYPSPLNFLEPLYASYSTPEDGGSNSSYYDNPAFDAGIAEGKAAVAASGNLADALPFYEAAEDVLCDDGSSIPVYFNVNQFAWNDTVSDVFMDAFGNVRFTSVKADSGVASLPLTEPVALLPMDVLESEGNQVTQNTLFTGLVTFSIDNVEASGNAESFTTDDGGKTWTIVLKDGWTFHNGEPVTAQSYVDAWSFGAVSAYGFQNNFYYSGIAGFNELNAE